MKLLTILKSLSKSPSFRVSFTFVIGMWILFSIFLFFISQSQTRAQINKEHILKQNTTEAILADFFESQARFGDIVYSRGMVLERGKPFGLVSLIICDNENEVLPALESQRCSNRTEQTHHDIIVTGRPLTLYFQWTNDYPDLWHTVLKSLLWSILGSGLLVIGASTVTYFVTVLSVLKYSQQISAIGDIRKDAMPTIPEIEPLLSALISLKDKLQSTLELSQHLRVDAALGQLSKQVAHDIRSPLSAVNMILPSLQGNHPEQTQILRTALKRINDIAQDLLDRKTAEENPSSDMKPRAQLMNSGFKEDRCSSQIEKCDVVLVVRQIVLEKNVQIQNSDIQITIDTEGESVFAQTNAKELSRILSNLLNNSIEAKDPERSLEIQIFIRQYNKQVSIVVMDNGVGIPSDKIALLGQVGVSFGKDQKSDFASHADNEKNVGSDLKHKSGTGLGLAHAKQALESWGGQLKIQSSVGVGTQMHLQLPGFEFRKH